MGMSLESVRTQKKIATKDMIMCALFTALIAVGAFIKVPVPVVPFTLQFLFTMLAGLTAEDADAALQHILRPERMAEMRIEPDGTAAGDAEEEETEE